MCTENKVIKRKEYPSGSIGLLFGENSILGKFLESLKPIYQYLIIIAAIIILFLLCLCVISIILKCCTIKVKSSPS